MAYSAYLLIFWHILHINHIFVCYSANWWWRRNTGKSRITELVRVCPSGQTAGSKKTPLQIPPCQAAIFQAFESTYGTAPRFDASLHTSWLEVALTTGVTMLWDGKWFCMAMLERWANMQCFLCFQIKLLVFCMNTMIHCTPLWACLLSLWTGVVSVFTASFDQIRCTCTIYASHAKYVWYTKICNQLHILHILHMT